jgi:hypothetical protein
VHNVAIVVAKCEIDRCHPNTPKVDILAYEVPIRLDLGSSK